MIAALLLAAGTSRRFGTAQGGKLTQHLAGEPLVRWSASALRDPRIAELLVVTGADDAAVRDALDGLGARFVRNPEPARGMGTSIACGVRALPLGTRAVVIGLGDEPFMERDVLTLVLDRYAATGAAIVAPRFEGVQGHPVLFSQATFGELAALEGDRGARAVIEREPARVSYVDAGRPAASDVDTPADLALARMRAQNRAPFTPQ